MTDTYEIAVRHCECKRTAGDEHMNVQVIQVNQKIFITLINGSKTHKNIYGNKRINKRQTSDVGRGQMNKTKTVG